jgi:UTP-glucose-1-phosphate uridylyltransferase
MLGDHLYASRGSVNCAAQLIASYEKTEELTVGLFEIATEDAPKYGVVKGTPAAGDGRQILLEAVTEKPPAEYARAHLGVGGRQYGVFMYVLTTEVYTNLKQQYENGKTDFGELQLTPALDAVIRTRGAKGLLIEGERFDVGLPAEYRATVARFGR